jgi:hypothetical protein
MARVDAGSSRLLLQDRTNLAAAPPVRDGAYGATAAPIGDAAWEPRILGAQ